MSDERAQLSESSLRNSGSARSLSSESQNAFWNSASGILIYDLRCWGSSHGGNGTFASAFARARTRAEFRVRGRNLRLRCRETDFFADSSSVTECLLRIHTDDEFPREFVIYKRRSPYRNGLCPFSRSGATKLQSRYKIRR